MSWGASHNSVQFVTVEKLQKSPTDHLCNALTSALRYADVNYPFQHLNCTSFVLFLGLLDLANSYCEPQLKQLCENVIKQGICVDNAAMLLAAAIKFNAKVKEIFVLTSIV